MLNFQPLQEIVDEIKRESLYSEQARYIWLVQKIGEMRLTHSKLVSEAEQRVSTDKLSWSQMIFTDLFGPDLEIMGRLTDRINRLEKNILKYYKEALGLYRLINTAP